jgi:hypothetical protein
MDSSALSVETVTRLQAFVRGSLCRARVSIMVKKLIDELMEAKGQPNGAADMGLHQDPPGQESKDLGGAEMERSKSQLNEESSPFLTASKENVSPGKLNKAMFEKSDTDGSIPPPPGSVSSPRRHLKNTVLQNNSTKHVASSEDLVHQHEVRVSNL